jgi:anthranilate synthase/aminodeoxychorismate synthase-like glutamine amidotransferase
MAPEIPILGVCLGHQAIVEAFGGETVPAVRLMHGKADRVYHGGRGAELFSGVSDGFAAGRYHSLAVSFRPELPIEVLAESDDGTIMAVRHSKLPTYGIQFHPESILTPDGMRILENFLRIPGPSSNQGDDFNQKGR